MALLAGMLEAVFARFGVGMLVGGFLSVALYRRRQSDGAITSGTGARLGAASGGIGFGIFALLTSLRSLISPTSEMRHAVQQALEQAAASNPSPQVQEMIHRLNSPEGLALMLTLSLIVSLVVFVLVSSLGGVIGAALLGRKNRS